MRRASSQNPHIPLYTLSRDVVNQNPDMRIEDVAGKWTPRDLASPPHAD